MKPTLKIILSRLSGPFEQNGIHVQIEIYRSEEENGWWLEVVDEEGTSTVWEEPFASDQDALDYFLSEVAAEGLESIVSDDASTIH